MTQRCTVAPGLKRLLVPITSITPDPANLRVHSERSIEAVAASLKRWGQQKPIVIDHAGVTVAGAGVLAAAALLKWTHVAAIRSKLAGVERVGYAIADNRTAELSSWDTTALIRTLGELSGQDLEAAGFTPAELEELGGHDPESLDDRAAPAPLKQAVAARGDLWQLGRHRILCGDSTSIQDVRRLMGKRKAALVSTDPPYLVNYTGERPAKPGNVDGGKDWSDVYREIDIVDAEKFFRLVFTAALEVLRPHAALYCWHAHRRIATIQQIWEELGILDHQQIVWVKPTSVLGRMYWHFQHEPCVMGWRKGSKPKHDGRHAASSVWVVPWDRKCEIQASDQADVWFCDWEGKARIVGNEHPTQKPIEIFARPIRKHTRRGELVFEPFIGSGSQLIAAEQLGRVCYGIELQPVFVDVAIRRWQRETGEAATLAGDGRTWDQVAKAKGIDVPDIDEPALSGKDGACPPDPSGPASTPVAPPSRARAGARPTPKRTPGKPPPRRRRSAATGGSGRGSASSS